MPQNDIVHIELPAKYRYLNIVNALIRAVLERVETPAVSNEMIYQIQLAIHEVCNNIIEHAYGHEEGQFQVVLTVPSPTEPLMIDLYDTGTPFDPATIAPPDLSTPRVEGYGLFLAHQLLDEVTYTATATTNHWHLVKAL
jgi:serine/threonine-protein kinase RsbW